jgi:hypothetical protein
VNIVEHFSIEQIYILNSSKAGNLLNTHSKCKNHFSNTRVQTLKSHRGIKPNPLELQADLLNPHRGSFSY